MKQKESISYEVDRLNRLVISSGKESGLPAFRSVADGEFKTDKNNTLIYQLRKSSGLPRQIKLRGKYSLNKNHNLVLSLDNENNRLSGNKLILKTGIINAKSDELAFSLSSKYSYGRQSFHMLRLSGKWQADKYNRLNFQVTKENKAVDLLTFTGSWEINKNNEIIYTCARSYTKNKTSRSNTLILRGYWEIAGKHRLIYVLDNTIGSELDFRVSLGKAQLRSLKYEIGIGKSPRKKPLFIFGEWKINNRLGLIFEIPTGKNTLNNIVFGADCKLTDNYNLNLKLKDGFNRDLGIGLKLSRSILKNQGEVFLKLLKEKREFSIAAGMGFRW
jgi:hypothetical protein